MANQKNVDIFADCSKRIMRPLIFTVDSYDYVDCLWTPWNSDVFETLKDAEFAMELLEFQYDEKFRVNWS